MTYEVTFERRTLLLSAIANPIFLGGWGDSVMPGRIKRCIMQMFVLPAKMANLSLILIRSMPY